MTYPAITAATPNRATYLTQALQEAWQFNQTFFVASTVGWFEVDIAGNPTQIRLGSSGPFVVKIDAEGILCSDFNEATGEVAVWQNAGSNGRNFSGSQTAHAKGEAGLRNVTITGTSVQSVATGGGGGGGGVGQTLMLSYNGAGPFSVPVSSLPADWSGDGTGTFLAQLTTGDDLISGLNDLNGDPIPDGWTFPALIFVEESTIFDLVMMNDYLLGDGIVWYGSEGGAPLGALTMSDGDGPVLQSYLPNTAAELRSVNTAMEAVDDTAGSTGAGGFFQFFSDNGSTCIFISDGSPVGVITPREVGDICVDNSTPAIWQATGTGNTDWVQVGSGGSSHNSILNGAMDIWQRGLTFSPTTETSYTADRWCAQSSDSNLTIEQGTDSPPAGFEFFARLVAASGSSSTFAFGQSLESVNVIPLQGETVTLSFKYKMPTNFTGPVVLSVAYSTETDENLLLTGSAITLTGGSNVDPSTGDITNEADWTTATATFAVPDNATSLGVQFTSTDNVVNGAEFDVTGVMLGVGASASPFLRAGGNFGGELSLCQRYFYSLNAATCTGTFMLFCLGICVSTTHGYGVVVLPVQMRVAPSLTTSDPSEFVALGATGGGTALSSIDVVQPSVNTGAVEFETSSGALVGGNATLLQANANNTAFLAFDSEI
jgi:hypothetical protein